ncbi:aminotransferase class V-fold PLP-dependent enzyme [Kineobactrum salinum]|uniref:Aminotransferase class V-fold PLP-dependent enzyme n=1 Tax=Kineobactrum salinum TaxID=2708301 RepID=A0A6C0TZE1_9GAMM|nr:aminotransferase class V-fold PLP-dependent enzyme [Kineobactrum salinum]QIB65190.1 aminotransferase class V-fold PLP-dependent enzyme [Kineobactrum salinum]
MTDYRDAFTPCEDIYLLNHSVGRMPRGTADYLQQHFFAAWESGAPEPWPQWLEAIDSFRAALARLFNSEPAHFCPQVNISSALSKVLGGLPPPADRNVILFTENDFPSVGFALQQAARLGFEPRMIAADRDPQQLATWEAALGPDVHTALITHAHFNSGKLVPVDAVTRLTRARGILSVVDIAQSAGVVPIDLQRWQADVVLGSCVKWLCGGPGAGFLWIDPARVASIEPLDVGWFSHAAPFEFDIHHFEYAPDSARFWGGTPSVLPCVVAAHSLDLIYRIGVDMIREHNQQLTQRIVDAVDPACLRAPADPALRGGTLVLNLPEQDAVEQRLRSAGVRFDVRPMGLRLSPHIYNSNKDIDAVIACLQG